MIKDGSCVIDKAGAPDADREGRRCTGRRLADNLVRYEDG